MKILIARHGQTDWNLKHKAHGTADVPLNRTGIEEAKAMAERLRNVNFDIILVSPLQRAKLTAEIINKGRDIPLVVDESVIERDFGNYEGDDIRTPEFKKLRLYSENIPIHNGQTSQEFALQVENALKAIIEKYKGKTVLIVTHSIFLWAAEWFFNGVPMEGEEEVEIAIQNCEIREYQIVD